MDDREALFSFIRSAYPSDWQYRVPERWEWLFLSNPFVPSGQLPIWIAEDDDGRIVAQTCAMLEPICFGNRERVIGWACNAVTLPEYRNRGIGTALEQLNAVCQHISARLGMPKEMHRIMRQLQADMINPASYYWRLLSCDRQYTNVLLERLTLRDGRLAEHFARLLRLPGVDLVITFLLRICVRLKSPKLRAPLEYGITIREILRFGEETDALWRRAGAGYDVIIRRDAEFCNWKYVDQPHLEYRRWFAWRGNEPAGYVVLRTAQVDSLRLGVIADVFTGADDQHTTQALIAFALSHFRQAGMNLLYAATTAPEIARGLRRAGFSKIGKEVPMIYAAHSEAHEAAAGAWFLGKSDCDWDASPLREKGAPRHRHP